MIPHFVLHPMWMSAIAQHVAKIDDAINPLVGQMR